MNILWFIMTFLLGGAIGGLIVLKYLEKSMDNLIDSYNALVKTYENIVCLDDKLIACRDKIIQDTYSYLVNLRDHGTESLDGVIGELGEILDNHKEE